MLRSLVLTLALSLGSQAAPPKGDVIDGYAARTYRQASKTMPYRLFTPRGYDSKQSYPLIVWLHGAGGIGADNRLQISGDQIAGTRIWLKPAVQAKYPAFIVVPQSAGGWGAQPIEELTQASLSSPLAMVAAIVESIEREFSIDPRRIYVAGQSDGGYGTWDLITKRPEMFAAAIPICGGGDPAQAWRAAALPVWAFHGDADRSVPVAASRDMVAALTKAGGHPRYTEYKGAGHDIWTRVFAEPELVEWLFAQRKPGAGGN